MKKRGAIGRVLVLGLLVSAVAYFALHRDYLAGPGLEHELRRFGRLAPVLFILLYALATVLFLPGSLLTVTGGAIFGWAWGTLWNLLGATLGATLAFVIARYVASDWVARRSSERLDQLMRGAQADDWRFVAFVRLVPLFPFNLVNYAFGLTPIALGRYMLTSFICMAPGALAYTYLGYAGRQIASGQAEAIRTAIVALALLAAVAFLPRFIRRLKGPRFIDAETVRRRLETGEEISLIDVRSADEFNGPLGHIAGAINVPVGELAGRLTELAGIKARPMVTI